MSFKKIGSLKKFEDFFKDENTVKKNPLKESVFLSNDTYKVKVVIDVPKVLIDEYIEKVKKETDLDPLNNFSRDEIAEQIVLNVVKKNMLIDNLESDFSVGTENISKNIKDDEKKSDEETLNNDLDIESDSDGEIEFKDFDDQKEETTSSSEDVSDGEIDFSENPTEKDLEEDRIIDNNKEKKDDDSDFEDFTFEEGDEENNKNMTVADFKNNLNKQYKKENDQDQNSSEEEEENLYKKIGYNFNKLGFYESLSNNLFKK